MTEKTIYQKLQAARVRLQQEQVRKSGANKFAGFVYFTLGDFLPMVNQIFDDLGICSVVTFTPEIATLRIVDVVTEKEIVFTSPMAEANLKGCHPIQNLGAVETYQRRYLYMAALEIAEHDILDMSADTKQTKHKSVAKETAATLDEVRLAQAQEAADECLACLPDEMAFYEAYESHKKRLDADTQVAMWGMLSGDNTPFPSANSVKTALARGKAQLEAAEITAQA
jgi:hypothetical protein